MKGLIFVKKLISGLLALTIAGSTVAMTASADDWRTIDVETNSITLRWQRVAGADGYRIYRWDVKDGKFVVVKTVGAKKTYYKITGLPAGATYKYVVKPYHYTNTSHTVFGNASSKAIVSTKPGTTTVTNKTRTSAKAVRVFWNKYGFKNNVDKQSNYKYGGYHVYVYDKFDDEWDLLACVSGGRTNVRVTGFKKNTKYTFKVKAITLSKVDGTKYEVEGDDSNTFTIKTKNYWCNC
jgi:hypothetical protein